MYAGILLLAAYILGLFVDLTGDAAKYGAIARHIVDSGDLIHLKIHGEAYEQKPQLLFWLSALGLKLGGIHNWSFKIFPTLYSFAGFWFTYKLGEIVYNRKTGQLAALMLATSWIYFFFTADIHTDLVLQANTTLAIWQLAAYLKTKRNVHFFWAFAGVGLAMLSKGPVGAVVPAFAIGVHLLFTRDFKQLFHPKWLIGICISFIISFPAFWGLYQQFGTDGLKFFFITNNIGRITGSYIGNSTDYFFYLHALAYLLLPWTFLMLFAFWFEIGSYFKKSVKKNEYFTVGAIWGYFLIVSVARAKAPHYIFIIVPLIMIVIAHWIDVKMGEAEQKNIKFMGRIQILVPFFLAVFVAVIIGYLFPSANVWLWLILLASVTFSILILRTEHSVGYRLFLPSVIMIATLLIAMNGHALPVISGYQASAKASRVYNEESSPNDKIYNYLFPYYEVFFYSKSGAERLYSIRDFNRDPDYTSWIFTTKAGKDTLQMYFEPQIEAIDSFKHRGMSTIRPDFVNPRTRESSLEPMYLIRIQSNPIKAE